MKLSCSNTRNPSSSVRSSYRDTRYADLKRLRKALSKGATLLLCSTTPSVYARSVEDKLKREGRDDIFLVDCPVSGGPKRASEGTLSIMAGGSDPAIRKARFLLEEMADTGKLAVCPGGIGAGSNMKMAHQVLAAIHILATSEAMGLAARLGLDMHQVRDAVMASEGWSFVYENRSPRLINREYTPPASALTIILKDVVCFFEFLSVHDYYKNTDSIA